MGKKDSKITLRAFAVGFLFAAIFAAITVYLADRRSIFATATQIPVLPYVLLFLTVLLINPLCRAIKIVRAFSPAEILIVFMMGLVSSGVSTFGLTAQLVPVVGSLFNRSWNNEQTEWNRHVVPFLNENYFVAERGIQKAAAEYAEAYEQRRRLWVIVGTASRYEAARQRLDASEEARDEARTEYDGTQAARMAIEREDRNVQIAGDALIQMRNAWNNLREDLPDLPDAATTLEQLRPRLADAQTEMEAVRQRLHELETVAFEKVEIFRRGLPRHMRAYPGFIKMPDDTYSSYRLRLGRMLQGRQVASGLRVALPLAAQDGPEVAAELASVLVPVREGLAEMAAVEALRIELDQKIEEDERRSREIEELQSEVRELNRRRREASYAEIRQLERQIASAQRRLRTMTRRRDLVAKDRDFLQQQLLTLDLATVMERQVADLKQELMNGSVPDEAHETLKGIMSGLPSIDGSLRRFLIGDVPWRDWAGPLSRWALVIGLTYLVLMTFNVLIFRQWAHNEKLIYPLAELPMVLAGYESESGAAPRVFRDGLFWVGFGISGAFLGFNALVYTQWIPGLGPLDFRNIWEPYLGNTAFQGLLGGILGGFARSEIFFTMIGLSFLIPKKVSFSLWFFSVLSMVQVLALVGFGYGQNEASFPNEWWYTLNFRTAQGGGALIVFSSVVLFKCRRYLLCAFTPTILNDLPADEQRELRISSFGFVLGSIGIVLTLWLSLGASLIYTIVTYFVIMVITIGLIRAVAEGGVLGFQAWANPFHFIRTFFGMDRAWTSAGLFAPLMVYYSILFLDIKTFIAPAMANSLKIRDDLKMQRGRFHLAIFAAILIAAVVAVAMSIMMSYSQGADLMNNWFYTGFPRDLFDKVATVSRTPPQASPGDTGWVIVGALAMAALLFFRQTAFWLPHPIGMIMLVNPIMGAYWFSIMIGWLAKSLVTKYGNKGTYARARTLFIGPIVGELLIFVVATVLTVTLDLRIPIDLNRN